MKRAALRNAIANGEATARCTAFQPHCRRSSRAVASPRRKVARVQVRKREHCLGDKVNIVTCQTEGVHADQDSHVGDSDLKTWVVTEEGPRYNMDYNVDSNVHDVRVAGDVIVDTEFMQITAHTISSACWQRKETEMVDMQRRTKSRRAREVVSE